MRHLLALIVLMTALSSGPASAEPSAATLYKNPQCGCCESYADYLRENGFEVPDRGRVSSQVREAYLAAH